MKTILISDTIIDLTKPESNNLLTAILRLHNSGFAISIESCPDYLLNILHNEGIQIINSEKLDKIHKKITTIEDNTQKSIIVNSESKIKNILGAVDEIIMKKRVVSHSRKTKETDIKIKLNLDGSGNSNISTGVGFFDHMIEQISRHGNIDLELKVKGDLHIDEHHTVEDVGIAIGEAIKSALGEKRGIARYGFVLPMDDSNTTISMDLGGRQFLKFKCKFKRQYVGDFPTELVEEFFKGISQGLNANIHIYTKGKNDHHKIESIFKAFAKALNEACRLDPRTKNNLPSTKGII